MLSLLLVCVLADPQPLDPLRQAWRIFPLSSDLMRKIEQRSRECAAIIHFQKGRQGMAATPFVPVFATENNQGINLFDYVAIQALQGILAGVPALALDPAKAAAKAVEHAEALTSLLTESNRQAPKQTPSVLQPPAKG